MRSGAFDSMGYQRPAACLQVVDAVIEGVSSAGRKNTWTVRSTSSVFRRRDTTGENV